MNGHPLRKLICVATGIALLAGCGAQQALPAQDKAGTQTLVLRLATVDSVVDTAGVDIGQLAFIKSLESVSGGLLKADVTTNYGDQATDAESRLVQAIASGEVDGGWPSIRAFANAGIPGLQAIEAPLTITSYAANKALVSGPVARDLLDQLKGTGVMGLGLTVGPLRRPFASEAPLLKLADWEGITFRSFNSPVQADTIRALGAIPVTAANDWVDQILAGTLRGVEFDIGQDAANGSAAAAPFITANVVLWPKVFVLALSQKRWDGLTDQQRSWVQQAADAATKASVDATYDETPWAAELCSAGAHLVDASSAQLFDLHAAVAPVIEKLAADPVNGPLLAEIQAIAAQYPQVEEPDVPAACRSVVASAPATIPEEVSSLPDGAYRHQVTAADVKAAGFHDVGLQGTWTLTVDKGTYALSCRFIDQPQTDCGESHFDGGTVELGRLRGTGNTVYFVGDLAMEQAATGCLLPESMTLDGHCVVIPPYWLQWSLDGDQLSLTAVGGDLIDQQEFSIVPWTKIN